MDFCAVKLNRKEEFLFIFCSCVKSGKASSFYPTIVNNEDITWNFDPKSRILSEEFDCNHEDADTSTLQIPDSSYEKRNTQNDHIISHFEYFFTCHYSKTVWLAENLNEIKITHHEKIFSHIKQKFSHFEEGMGNVLIKKIFFCLTEIIIIFTETHCIKSKPKIITKISNYLA